jgi:hypothetical protein
MGEFSFSDYTEFQLRCSSLCHCLDIHLFFHDSDDALLHGDILLRRAHLPSLQPFQLHPKSSPPPNLPLTLRPIQSHFPPRLLPQPLRHPLNIMTRRTPPHLSGYILKRALRKCRSTITSLPERGYLDDLIACFRAAISKVRALVKEATSRVPEVSAGVSRVFRGGGGNQGRETGLRFFGHRGVCRIVFCGGERAGLRMTRDAVVFGRVVNSWSRSQIARRRLSKYGYSHLYLLRFASHHGLRARHRIVETECPRNVPFQPNSSSKANFRVQRG